MKKPALYTGLLVICLGLLMAGCEDIETDPGRILPVLRQAYRCCEGGQCNELYWGLTQEVACTDVRQMELCLQGNRDQCPRKGYGGF